MRNYLQRVALSAARAPAGASPARVSPPHVPGPAFRVAPEPLSVEAQFRQAEAASLATLPKQQTAASEAPHEAAHRRNPEVEQSASATSERRSPEPVPRSGLPPLISFPRAPATPARPPSQAEPPLVRAPLALRPVPPADPTGAPARKQPTDLVDVVQADSRMSHDLPAPSPDAFLAPRPVSDSVQSGVAQPAPSPAGPGRMEGREVTPNPQGTRGRVVEEPEKMNPMVKRPGVRAQPVGTPAAVTPPEILERRAIGRDGSRDARISIGRIDVQVNNHPAAAAVTRPAKRSGSASPSGFEAPHLGRFLLRP